MKLYFFGGEDVGKRESLEIHKRAFRDAGKTPTVLIFPWTSEVEKTEYRSLMGGYFKDVGAGKISFAELSDSPGKLVEKIKRSGLIYLPGGDDRILVERLKKRKLGILFKKYPGVIAGNSAGSLALCRKYVVIKGQDGEPETTAKTGMGLAPFAVAVHYGSSNPALSGRNSGPQLTILSKKTKLRIYAVPETSALVYDGKKIVPVGDVYLFEKGRKTKI